MFLNVVWSVTILGQAQCELTCSEFLKLYVLARFLRRWGSLSAMEPTSEERSSLGLDTSVEAIATWAGMPTQVFGSWSEHLGFEVGPKKVGTLRSGRAQKEKNVKKKM